MSKLYPFMSRKDKLKRGIKQELSNPVPNIRNILSIIDQYEKNNLDTINKLRREQILTIKRINGGLKATIKAHGAIGKELINSASKRIYGSLLSNKAPVNKPKFSWKWLSLLLITEIIMVATIFYLS